MKKLNEVDINTFLDYCFNKGEPYEVVECFQELVPMCRFDPECKKRMKDYCDAHGIEFDEEEGIVHVEKQEIMNTYLTFLQEYEEVDFFEHCIKGYHTTEERVKCLRIARTLCGGNIICQNRVDRYIDGLTNDFEEGPYNIDEGLGKTEIMENYDIDATGMMGRTPPLETEEVEITDEEADKQNGGKGVTVKFKRSDGTQSEEGKWTKQVWKGEDYEASVEQVVDILKQELGDKPLDQIKEPGIKKIGENYKSGTIREKVLLKLIEAGFAKYPKGWTRKSVVKFGKTIGKGYHGSKSVGPKSIGFFDRCVKRMRGKVSNPEGFCASVKDVAHQSTGWRGKDKTPAEVKKSVRKPQYKIKP